DEINAISALELAAKNAEADVAGLDQRIATHSAGKPQSTAVQKPGKLNFAIEILDRQDLGRWSDQLVALQRQRQQAQGVAALARSKFNERLGVRAFDQARINALNDPTKADSIPAF